MTIYNTNRSSNIRNLLISTVIKLDKILINEEINNELTQIDWPLWFNEIGDGIDNHGIALLIQRFTLCGLEAEFTPFMLEDENDDTYIDSSSL